MTFVTSDGVEQVAEIYVMDICEGQDAFPNSTTKQAMYMGWHALNRQGVEPRSFAEWFPTIRNVPDIDLEEVETPKE
jgi:hypothetical protein